MHAGTDLQHPLALTSNLKFPITIMLSLVVVCLLGTSSTLATAISPAQAVFPESLPHELSHDVVNKGVLSPEFYRKIESTREKYEIKGVSMAIVHADADPEYGSWGIRTEDGDPVTPDTLFLIGSCSKAFTASSIGILIDDYAHDRNVTPLPDGLAEFTWSTKVKDLLPEEWALADEWATEKANIRDILAHVSGIPRHDLSYDVNDSSSSVIKKLRYLRPRYELREKWSYNNQMYITAGHIASQLSNSSFPELIRERIFEPLNMSSTMMWPYKDESLVERVSHAWQVSRRIPIWFFNQPSENIQAAGGIVSSVRDMAKWVRALLHKGVDPVSNKTVLPRPDAFDVPTTPYTFESPSALKGYGAGWGQQIIHGHKMIQHGGGIPGFLTELAFFPDDGIGFVFMINTINATGLVEMFNQTVNAVLGIQTEEGTDSASELTESGEFTPDHFPTTSLATGATPVEHSAQHEHQQGPQRGSLSLHALAGTYWNDGYGTLTICAPETISPYCQRTRADFAAIDNNVDGAPQRSETQLVAAWSRLVTSHMRLVPRANAGEDGPTNTSIIPFTMQLLSIFPKGYGLDKTPFVIEEIMDIDAEFVFGAAAVPLHSSSNLDINNDGADEEQQLEVLGLGVRGLDLAEKRLPAREGWDVYWRKIRPDW